MADYDFLLWSIADLSSTGPDPFANDSDPNFSSPGAATLTIGAPPSTVTISDDDTNFEDGDNSQTVGGNQTDTEYSYVIRPEGSSNPADNITIYVVFEGATLLGITSDGLLVAGNTYDIISVESSGPSVAYSSLFVCFAGGTRILSERGEVSIDNLQVGDRVMTVDRGLIPIKWIDQTSHQWTAYPDKQKPIMFKRGSLGAGLPRRDLIVSPQHRILFPDGKQDAGVLGPAKAMTGMSGVRQMQGCREIEYFHLMFDRHEVVISEGAPTESFYPGPYIMKCFSEAQREEVSAVLADWPSEKTGEYKGARPFTTVKETKALVKQRVQCWSADELQRALGPLASTAERNKSGAEAACFSTNRIASQPDCSAPIALARTRSDRKACSKYQTSTGNTQTMRGELIDFPRSKSSRLKLDATRTCSSVVSSSGDPLEASNRIIDHLHQMLSYRRSAIILKRLSDGRPLIFSHCKGFLEDKAYAKELERVNRLIEIKNRGVVHSVLASGKEMVIGDVGQHDGYVSADDSMRSEACFPLIANGQCIGALNVESENRNAFDDADAALLATVSTQLALMVDRTRIQGSYGITDQTDMQRA